MRGQVLVRFGTKRLESSFIRRDQRRVAVVNMKLCSAVSDGAAEIPGIEERRHGVASGIGHEKIFATAVTRLGFYGCWQPFPNFRSTGIGVRNRSLNRGCKSKYKSRERC